MINWYDRREAVSLHCNKGLKKATFRQLNKIQCKSTASFTTSSGVPQFSLLLMMVAEEISRATIVSSCTEGVNALNVCCWNYEVALSVGSSSLVLCLISFPAFAAGPVQDPSFLGHGCRRHLQIKKGKRRRAETLVNIGFVHTQQSLISSNPLASAGSSSSFALLLVLLGASTPSALWQNLLLHHVNDLIRDPQILDGASPDVAFRHSPEFVSILSPKTYQIWHHLLVQNLHTSSYRRPFK